MKDWLNLLQKDSAIASADSNIIAVIRTDSIQQGSQLATAVAMGGIRLIEITWNSDKPEQLVGQLRQKLPLCTIGAGTILNLEQLESAISCGCEFIFCPHVNATLIATACRANIPIIPGALTPTEIITAWELGASSVKVFPIQAVGGVAYLQAIQAPLANIPLIPTGGVTFENTKAFLDAGAVAVGLSSQLFPKDLVEAEDWDAIAQRTKRFLKTLKD